MICAYQKMSKKVGSWRIEREQLLCHWPWEMKETRCSVISKEKKSPHNRKLTESFICVQFETVFFTFSIVRTMWHASWYYKKSWSCHTFSLFFRPPNSVPSYHRWYERKQANYRVGIEGWSDRSYSLDKRCWGYVYMITSASLRTHALRRPLFSSQKLQALEDTQQIFKIGNFGDEAFYLLAGVYYANNSTIINNNNSKLDF